jgi:TolA-binding protein
MVFRAILALMLTSLQGLDADPVADDALRLGEQAMSAGLWEVAAMHFEEGLQHVAGDDAVKSRLAVLLGEAWVRDGRAAETAELLGKSKFADSPGASFWHGQALASLGRFADAVKVLSGIAADPDAVLRNEAVFTIKNLQLSLERPDEALDTLGMLEGSANPEVAREARLHQVEILLDLGRTEEARARMPESPAGIPPERPLERFLEAQLALAEGRPSDAAEGFKSLAAEARDLGNFRRDLAAVGLADALRADGKADAASTFLLGFIQDHPDSPQLEPLFRRLAAWLPEVPAMTDPVLERLAQWIPAAKVPPGGMIAQGSSDAVTAGRAASAVATGGDLAAFAIFTRALGLARIPTSEARLESRRLFNRLRLEYPDHFLAKRSLLESARHLLEADDFERALLVLEVLRENTYSPELRGKAGVLGARAIFERGDPESAARLFAEAAESLQADEAEIARFNAAISRLTADRSTPLTVLKTGLAEGSKLAADLEIERALAVVEPQARRAAIEEFLGRHPGHAREFEARLSAAEAALAAPKPDVSFARAQLETITAAGAAAALPAGRLALVRLRIEDLSGQGEAAIASARAMVDQFAGEPAADEAAFLLGRMLFESRNFNDARLVLEKLAASDADAGRAQAALLLAARAAALVPTNQSRQEALALFDKIIEGKGPLAAMAVLEKSKLMIDMNRLEEATGFLRKWFGQLPPEDPLHLPAGLLLWEALYAQGGSEPLGEALAICDKLLANLDKFQSGFNRLHYHRGRTLEQMPDPQDPTRKREREAFIAYYRVLETTGPPAEWHYFELCGFRALALLEKAGRWPAAIACAKKIASFKGPLAEEASARANQLQLKHMVWED